VLGALCRDTYYAAFLILGQVLCVASVPGAVSPYIEGYSGHSVEVQANYR